MKNLVFIHNVFKEQELYKDSFIFPRYIAQHHGLNPSIIYHVTSDTQKLAPQYLDVELTPLKYKGKLNNFSFRGAWYLFIYCIRNASRMDVLVRMHISYQTVLFALIYKLFNKKGTFILRTDGYGIAAALKRPSGGLVRRQANRTISQIISSLLKRTDQICVETPDLYDFLTERYPQYSHKMRFILMGFDEELYQSDSPSERPLTEKENIMIASGRIGSKQKNTELLLEAAANVDLKNWKLVLIGPIESDECDFQKYIDGYFKKYPQLKEHIIFTGEIKDRKAYWEWFDRASVFVHTAIYESYGIVLTEATRFKNYIISTDVGIAREMIAKGSGEIIPSDNPEKLGNILQAIVNGEKNVKELIRNNHCKPQDISYENEIKKLSLNL
ncbi:MAG: glycosyltransferase family 4 protein [Mediterranea sp.]|jgi:glycosyltransferase involved in cell wall biosynthesis|nr:glycosyltransferase family 4 protein [Mediterranea sp.]